MGAARHVTLREVSAEGRLNVLRPLMRLVWRCAARPRYWLSYGGRDYAPLPSMATREQQILIAEKVRADRGFSRWSSCARELGLL